MTGCGQEHDHDDRTDDRDEQQQQPPTGAVSVVEATHGGRHTRNQHSKRIDGANHGHADRGRHDADQDRQREVGEHEPPEVGSVIAAGEVRVILHDGAAVGVDQLLHDPTVVALMGSCAGVPIDGGSP